MEFNRLIKLFNIQALIILINLSNIIYYLFSLSEGFTFDKSLLYSSTINLVITIFLYYKFIKNRFDLEDMDGLKDVTEINHHVVYKLDKELNYILINLIILFIYSMHYFVYMLGVLVSQ